MAPADCAPSTSSGSPVSALSASIGRTFPVTHDTCESASSRVFGPTAESRASRASSCDRRHVAATRTRAPDAWSGPSRPKCSSSVVTISSSGSNRSPERTIWQPVVVDAVTAMWSEVVPRNTASRSRTRALVSMRLSKYGLPLRPCSSSSAVCALTASMVSRASGPNVPALRYATRSRTGKLGTGEHYFSAVAEVVGLGQRRAHLGETGKLARERAEALELRHDDVDVAADFLQAASDGEQRLAPYEGAVALVHLRRYDEVDEAVLVLEQHEDDAVRGHGALACDRQPRHRQLAAVGEVGQLDGGHRLRRQVWTQQLEWMDAHR